MTGGGGGEGEGEAEKGDEEEGCRRCSVGGGTHCCFGRRVSRELRKCGVGLKWVGEVSAETDTAFCVVGAKS